MARRKTWARPETAAEIERMGGRETLAKVLDVTDGSFRKMISRNDGYFLNSWFLRLEAHCLALRIAGPSRDAFSIPDFQAA
jgi:hypothetical protein